LEEKYCTKRHQSLVISKGHAVGYRRNKEEEQLMWEKRKSWGSVRKSWASF